MKLRIRGNTLRVRVTQTEAARLAAGERIEQITEFTPSQRLISSVEPSAIVNSPAAAFQANEIKLLLPMALVKTCAGSSDAVTITGAQLIDEDRSLEIMVEKDFECLHSKVEEDADAFPNPRLLKS